MSVETITDVGKALQVLLDAIPPGAANSRYRNTVDGVPVAIFVVTGQTAVLLDEYFVSITEKAEIVAS